MPERQQSNLGASAPHVSPLARHPLTCGRWLRQSQPRENHQIQLPTANNIILSIANLLAIVHGKTHDGRCLSMDQILQQLQQQQAALYGGMGAMYMPQYYPHHPDQMGSNQSGVILGSILASGQPHQQTLRPGQQARDSLALERAARLCRSAAPVCEVCNISIVSFGNCMN